MRASGYLVVMNARIGTALVVVGFGVTIWAAVIASYAQATGDFDPWPFPWLWVVLGIVAMVAILLVIPWRARTFIRKGPDFRFSYRGPMTWEVERVRSNVAGDVRRGDGIMSGTGDPMPLIDHMGDLQHGMRRLVTLPNSSGTYVPLFWREGDKHFYSKSAFLADGGADVEVRGIERLPGTHYQT